MRYYSSTAGQMTLTADAAAADGVIQVDTTTGLPVSFPYTLVLDPGQTAEEIITVTSAAGTTLTVSRAQDGTSAQSHGLGATVRHMLTARDLREPQEHIAATAAVHGVTGSLVGLTDVQRLDNKTFQSTDGTTTPITIQKQTGGSKDLLQFRDELGNVLSSSDGAAWISDGATVRNGGSANFWKRVIDAVCSAVDVVGVMVKGYPGQTADLQQWQKSDGTVLASVDKDGNVTSPTVTSLQSADTALGDRATALEGRATAIETNLGSQTTFAATSAAKDGKRLHWGTAAVDIGTDGYVTAPIAHGAGFAPSVILAQSVQTTGALYGDIVVDSFTATTFRARMFGLNGAAPATAVSGYPIQFFCGE